MSWENIITDSEFQSQPESVKMSVARNYYKQNIYSDPDYQKLPQEERSKIAFNFFKTLQTPNEPQQGAWEGFIKPTLKAIPKVGASVIGGMGAMPIAGLGALAKTITSGIDEGGKTYNDTMSAYQDILTTDAERQGAENIGLVAKPIEMAGQGWEEIVKLTPLEGTIAEPIANTIGQAAAIFGTGGAKKVALERSGLNALERGTKGIFESDRTPTVMNPEVPREVHSEYVRKAFETEGQPIALTDASYQGKGQNFTLSESKPETILRKGAGKENLPYTTGEVNPDLEVNERQYYKKDLDILMQKNPAGLPKDIKEISPAQEFFDNKQRANESATLYSGIDPTIVLDKIENSKVGKSIIEFFSPGSTIPKGEDWMYARQSSKGGIARGENLAETFVNKYKDLSMEDRQQIWNFMDGRIKLEELPDNLQTPAKRMRMIDNVIGKRLADEGVISKETFEANKDKHIRYIYNIYQQGQDLMGGGGVKLNTKNFAERTDWGQVATRKHLNENFNYLPKEELQSLNGFLDGTVDKTNLPNNVKWIADQLIEKKAEFKDIEQTRTGLIKDPIQAMTQSIVEGEKAVAMSKYFKKISETPEWVFEPSVLKINGIKMGLGKAQSMIEAMDKVGDLNPEQIKYKTQIETAIQDATMKMGGKPPKGFLQLTGKQYGALDGMFVNKTIAQDIKPIFALGGESSSTIVNVIREGSAVGTGLWKMKNVALNIPTMARNVVSNNIQLLMSGMGPHKLALKFPEAVYSIVKKDQDWRALMRQGGFKTNFATGELSELVDIAKSLQDSPNIVDMVSKMQSLGKFYGKIDDVFKLTKFKDLRSQGVETSKAAREAIKWGMDYSLAHPSIKVLRNVPLGSPFFTYQYKIAPLIVESIKQRPWVVGGIMSLPWIVQKAVIKDMTDEDAKKYIESLPSYVQNGQVFMIPGANGMNALDVSYMVPWGNWYQVGSSAAQGKGTTALKELGISQGLLPTLTYAAITGKDLFTNRDIVDDLDKHDPKATAWALTKYIWQTATPPMLGENGVAGKVAEHLQHGQTRSGLKTEGMNVYPRIVGANIYPVDPMGRTKQDMMDIKKVKKAFVSRLFDKNITPEEKQKLVEVYKQSLVDIKEQ
ncbi:MAG: hypothetical protein WC332_00040 [Clostridia bacterium]|jgi:hypothetical protein